MKQYQQRISGPLLDRIDLQVDVPRLNETDKTRLLEQGNEQGQDSACIRERVVACRHVQLSRTGRCNARLDQHDVKQLCALSTKDSRLLSEAMNRLRFSARAYFRILKISRTIADLAGVEHIAREHLLEAINYRRFDASS